MTARHSPAPAQPLPGSDRIGPASEIWASTAWRRAATDWIDESLTRRGVTRVPTTPLQPRIRPWSTQLVVETSQGRCWFKAGVPEQSPEAVILTELTKVAPDLLPPVWAHDAQRCWMLMPDQGTTLRDVVDAESVVPALSAVLRRYGRLQRASVSVAESLAAQGVAVFSPGDLVDAWAAIVDATTRRRGMARLADAAERLDALEMPLTIQHDDLHVGNVFAAGAAPTQVQESTIFDWGDAYVSHPMLSLLITLHSPSYYFGSADDPERDRRLVRAYAAGWAPNQPTAAILDALDDALLLARIGRIVGWQRALARATTPEKAKWGTHAQQWLDEITTLL